MEQHVKIAMRREMVVVVRDLPACPDGAGRACPSCVAEACTEVAEKYLEGK